MSLEAILSEHLVALKENNVLLAQAAEGRKEVLAAAKEASTKPAAKAADKKASAEPDKKPAADAPAGDEPTVENVNDAIVGYITPATRPEEREARKAKVTGIIKKVAPEGTEKFNGGAVPADKRKAFINTMKKLLTDGDLTEAPAADEPETDEADSLLD